MLTIAVCDDDAFETILLSTYIKEYQKQHTDVDIYVESFHSSRKLWEKLDDGTVYDIYLLDIIMPEIDGLELGKKIRSITNKGIIIYLTSSKEYALDAYQVYAMQYLVKPIEQETLSQTMDRAIESLEPSCSSSFAVKSSEGTIRLHYASICYVECQRHSLSIYTSDGRRIPTRSIRVPFETAVEELLNDPRFVRIHQSYVVNLDFVKNMTNQAFELQFHNKCITLPISKNRFQKVKKAFLENTPNP
ncbi:MAG: LytR/AlgR family response regulator transcription factor [Lachnospiraceae bacterium]